MMMTLPSTVFPPSLSKRSQVIWPPSTTARSITQSTAAASRFRPLKMSEGRPPCVSDRANYQQVHWRSNCRSFFTPTIPFFLSSSDLVQSNGRSGPRGKKERMSLLSAHPRAIFEIKIPREPYHFKMNKKKKDKVSAGFSLVATWNKPEGPLCLSLPSIRKVLYFLSSQQVWLFGGWWSHRCLL